MDSSFWYEAINLGWPSVYIEGLQVIISRKNIFISLKCVLILANSVDPDEMPHHAAFHLGLHCFLKYAFTCSTHCNKLGNNYTVEGHTYVHHTPCHRNNV